MLIAHCAMQLNHHTRVTRVMCYTCNILQSLPGIVLLPPGDGQCTRPVSWMCPGASCLVISPLLSPARRPRLLAAGRPHHLPPPGRDHRHGARIISSFKLVIFCSCCPLEIKEWCVHTKTRGCMQCDETETAIYRIGLMWIRSRDDADWLHNLQCSLELEIIKKNQPRTIINLKLNILKTSCSQETRL